MQGLVPNNTECEASVHSRYQRELDKEIRITDPSNDLKLKDWEQ